MHVKLSSNQRRSPPQWATLFLPDTDSADAKEKESQPLERCSSTSTAVETSSRPRAVAICRRPQAVAIAPLSVAVCRRPRAVAESGQRAQVDGIKQCAGMSQNDFATLSHPRRKRALGSKTSLSKQASKDGFDLGYDFKMEVDREPTVGLHFFLFGGIVGVWCGFS